LRGRAPRVLAGLEARARAPARLAGPPQVAVRLLGARHEPPLGPRGEGPHPQARGLQPLGDPLRPDRGLPAPALPPRAAMSWALAASLAAAPAQAKPTAPKPAAEAKASTAPAAGLPVFAASTGPVTVEMVIARFEEFDKQLKSLSAEYRQILRWEESGLAQSV